VAGTLAVGAQLTPMPASEAPQPPEQNFSSTQKYADELASLYSGNGNPVTLAKNLISSRISDPLDQCRILEASQNKINYGDKNYTQAGFPVSRLTPNSGVVKWALIPIDFSDLRGEKKFRPRVNKQMRILSDWYSTVSGGRLKVEWVVLDKWVTLPGKAKDYSVPRSVNLGDSANGKKLFRNAMTAADPMFDFTNIQTVNFILPKGQKIVLESSQGFPWDPEVKEYSSDEGPISSFSIPGAFFDEPNRTYWSYWAHEFGHAISLPHIGLSRGITPPFNPWDLMGGQDGPSRELSGWLRMLAGWLSDSQVYCKSASDIRTQTVNLAPISSKTKGLKLAIIRLSKTKAIMIESRRETKFSCKTNSGRNGVLVYLFDAKLGHGEDFLVPVSVAGRTPKQVNCATAPHPDVLLRAGDRVSVEGMTVEVVKISGKDTVRISKRN
jgi:M6 family metalloprotease-like protein